MRSLHSLSALRTLRLRPPQPQSTRVSQIRHFSPSKPRPFVANDMINASTAFIYGIHSFTGLSWVYSIPLTAFIVRMGVALPLQIYSRVNARKERDLWPLTMSWTKHIKDTTYHGVPVTDPNTSRVLDNHVISELRKIRSQLRRRWGVPRFYKFVTIFQLPVWLCLMESVRSMCGGSHGLIPYLLSFMRTGEHFVPPPPEPTFASEGALWFPDLLAGDPTAILPILLGASILFNVHVGWKAAPLAELSQLPGTEMTLQASFRFLRTIVQFLAVNVAVAAFLQEMPCALLLYWITSTNVANLQTYLLEKYMHSTPPLKPWKRYYLAVLEPGQKRRPSQKPVL